MEEARLVFHVPQIPKLHRVVDRGRRQQPITAGVEFCMCHFGFVQLFTENLQCQKKKKPTTSRLDHFFSIHCDAFSIL